MKLEIKEDDLNDAVAIAKRITAKVAPGHSQVSPELVVQVLAMKVATEHFDGLWAQLESIWSRLGS